MTTFNNVEGVFEDWVSIYSILGVSQGVALLLQNEGINWFILKESVDKPPKESLDGLSVTSLVYGNQSSKLITEGSIDVWLRPRDYGKYLRIAVQEV